MSGTSLDGVDAALVEIRDGACRLAHAIFQPFDNDLRHELLTLNRPSHNELLRSSLAGNELASLYAYAVQELLEKAKLSAAAISAIGCHGQTIRHRPDLGFTLQIGNSALLSELTNITVISDFRSRDIAAGGQGAPLVPAFHAAAFRSDSHNRIIVNIGGISNLTWLPSTGTVTGFDCGPGNLLLDGWTQDHLNAPFDRDGAWAASGKPSPELLRNMLADDFFSAPPPKSTGRDMFNLEWLQSHLSGGHASEDVQATLLELTARTISEAIQKHCEEPAEIYLCGGGGHNSALKRRLAALLDPLPIRLTDELGIDADWVEATAFAWLAYRTQHGLPGNLPDVTGAQAPRVLGAIYTA